MKKTWIALAICAAACCFTACDTPKNTQAYDALNDMLHADYSALCITVTDTVDETSALTSTYEIEYTESGATVHYTVERFAELSLDGASGEKKVLTGDAVIKDGAVVSVSGDDVGITAEVTERSLTFKEEYFENAVLNGVSLRASVKDAAAFMGTELKCTDMSVKATFLEYLYEISVSYTSENGNQVNIQYTFTI